MWWLSAVSRVAVAILGPMFASLKTPTEIWDITHVVLPHVGGLTWVATAVTSSVAAAGLLLGAKPIDIGRRVWLPVSALKGAVSLLTVLPDSNPDCRFAAVNPFHCSTRNDMIISGHMVAALAGLIMLRERFVRGSTMDDGKKPFVEALGFGIAIVCAFLLCASRLHYTMDVALAWAFVSLFDKLRDMEDTLARSIPKFNVMRAPYFV